MAPADGISTKWLQKTVVIDDLGFVCCSVIYLLCIQELVGRPMYTELVEGEQGKLEPENNTTAAVGIKKFLVDVSNISCYCFNS